MTRATREAIRPYLLKAARWHRIAAAADPKRAAAARIELLLLRDWVATMLFDRGAEREASAVAACCARIRASCVPDDYDARGGQDCLKHEWVGDGAGGWLCGICHEQSPGAFKRCAFQTTMTPGAGRIA